MNEKIIRVPMFLSVIFVLSVSDIALSAERKAGKPIGVAVEFTSHSACGHIARNKGWFKEKGIDLKTYDSYITGTALAAALVRGGIDSAYICLIPAINAYANAGVSIKVVSGIHKYGYGFVINTDRIKTIKDLEGSHIRIGCTREGSPGDFLLHKMMDKYNLDKVRISRKVRRMDSPKQLLALKMQRLDAAMVCEQYPSMAEELGFKVLLTARDLCPDMQGSVLVVMKDLIRDYPDIVKKLVKVTDRATIWLNDYPEDAARIVTSGLSVAGEKIFPIKAARIAAKIEITPEVMLMSLTKRLDCTTEINPEEIQNTIDYMAKLGYINKGFRAEEILDLRWLKE
ncbi:MAG: ABC transporter substrate-binding protein [Thermodesulfobacteriota bacterium]|nr:ABC transporter substrate-binding protein [Thermodesulfobacteriota bacterium]